MHHNIILRSKDARKTGKRYVWSLPERINGKVHVHRFHVPAGHLEYQAETTLGYQVDAAPFTLPTGHFYRERSDLAGHLTNVHADLTVTYMRAAGRFLFENASGADIVFSGIEALAQRRLGVRTDTFTVPAGSSFESTHVPETGARYDTLLLRWLGGSTNAMISRSNGSVSGCNVAAIATEDATGAFDHVREDDGAQTFEVHNAHAVELAVTDVDDNEVDVDVDWFVVLCVK